MQKTKFLVRVFLLTFLLFLFIGTAGAFSSGAGTEEDPFLITTPADFNMVRNNLTGCYKLANDIDLAWNLFTPIGTSSAPFKGTFDGDGHTISNLRIKGTANYTGLFGYVSGGTVKNLNIHNADITSSADSTGTLAGGLGGASIISDCSVTVDSGTDSRVYGVNKVGGLIGASGTATIRNSFSEIDVTAASASAGGFIGEASRAKISRSYATGSVMSATYAGGFIGRTDSGFPPTMSDCFSLGDVTATANYAGGFTAGDSTYCTNCYSAGKVTTPGANVGGFCKTGSPKNSYFDAIAAGQPNQPVGAGKLTSGMKASATFVGITGGWDFDTIWTIDEGTSYPYLRNLPKPDGVASGLPVDEISSGNGTASNPYMITTAAQMQNVKYDLTGCYKLANDIDLAWDLFTPIGTHFVAFKGMFDGDGHTISNLRIKGTANYIGLFGSVSGGTVENLNIHNADITSTADSTGALVGYLSGTAIISDCSVTVDSGTDSRVYGVNKVGGLIGASGTATIRNSFSEIDVTAASASAGGFIGEASRAKISRSYATGSVMSATYAGGFIGRTDSGFPPTMSDCFSLGDVTATANYAGGFTAGDSTYCTNCYSAGKVTSPGFSVGGFAKTGSPQNAYFDATITGIIIPAAQARTTAELQTQATFTGLTGGWDFDSIWTIQEGVTYPYLRNIKIPDLFVPPVIHVTGVSLNQTVATLEPQDKLQLMATIAPTTADNKAVIWTSSDSAIAVVDSNGLVTALAGGAVTITVTTVDGNLTAECIVTVVNADIPNPPSSDGLIDINDNVIGTSNNQIQYLSTWTHHAWDDAYQGDETITNIPGAAFYLQFNSTRVRWYGALDDNFGTAVIYIDGMLAGEVDCYQETRLDEALLFDSGILNAGQHTLTVVLLYEKNAASTDRYITVDKLTIGDAAPTQPDQIELVVNDNTVGTTNHKFEYHNNWVYHAQTNAYLDDETYTNTPGDSFQIKFDGTQIKWYGATNNTCGIADVYLDGMLVSQVNCYQPFRTDEVLLFDSGTLEVGEHTLLVVLLGVKDDNSSNFYITVDKAVIYQS